MRTVEIPDAREGMKLAQPVYTRNGNLLIDVGSMLSAHMLDLLDLWGIFSVQIDDTEDILPGGAPGEAPVSDPREHSKTRVRDMNMRMRSEVQKFMTNVHKNSSGVDIEKIKALAASMVTEALESPEMMLSLTSIHNFDTYLFSHSMHVAILGAIVGIGMELSSAEIHSIAMGAMLIDVGMLEIDPQISNKEGPLTDAEFDRIKSHPVIGLKMAAPYCQDDNAALRIVVEHHERLDGSGYPRTLNVKTIHPLAKIVAVCDIYDAMQAPKRYRKKWLPHQVMSHLLVSSTETLDADVVKVFLRTMSSYPIGSFVRMDTGHVGVVVSANRASPIRPVVKFFMGPTGEHLEKSVFIDLTDHKGFIAGPVDPRELGVSAFEMF